MLNDGSAFRPTGAQVSLWPSTSATVAAWNSSTRARQRRAYASICTGGQSDSVPGTPTASASIPIAYGLVYADERETPAWLHRPAAITNIVPSRPSPYCASGPGRPFLPSRTTRRLGYTPGAPPLAVWWHVIVLTPSISPGRPRVFHPFTSTTGYPVRRATSASCVSIIRGSPRQRLAGGQPRAGWQGRSAGRQVRLRGSGLRPPRRRRPGRVVSFGSSVHAPIVFGYLHHRPGSAQGHPGRLDIRPVLTGVSA